jgi:putative hydrolase of the HAD superfamily
MSEIRCIFVDCGSVLLEDFPEQSRDSCAAWRDEVAKRYGLASGKDLHDMIYCSESWKRCKVGKLTSMEMLQEVWPAHSLDTLTRLLTDYRAGLSVHPQLSEVILSVDPTVRMCVLSNHDDTLCQLLQTKAAAVMHRFERVFNSYDLGVAKPDPEIFHRVLNEVGLSPQQCLLIDDKPKNLQAAAQIGISTFLYQNNPKQLGDLLSQLNLLS